jgi:hypothetical protein
MVAFLRHLNLREDRAMTEFLTMVIQILAQFGQAPGFEFTATGPDEFGNRTAEYTFARAAGGGMTITVTETD